MVLSLRSYQQRIVQDVGFDNAIIKMPTGSGKTFVAGELVKRRLEHVKGKSAIFLVPTVDLVEQQALALETWSGIGIKVVRFHGGLSPSNVIGQNFQVLVTTPTAFLRLQEKHPKTAVEWNCFSICVFDEVHHVIKDHPYRKVAFRLKRFLTTHNNCDIQIIGLSASLTYAVTDLQISKALDGLVLDLGIVKLCSPTSEELVAGGYKPQNGNVEIVDTHEAPDDVVPEWERQPHLLLETFLKRIEAREATEFALLMWDTVKLLESYILTLVPSFASPLNKARVSIWEDCPSKYQARYPSHSVILLKLEHWYVGLKLLVVTWEEEIPLTLRWLLSTRAVEDSSEFPTLLRDKFSHIRQLASNALNFPKLNLLTDQLLAKKARFGESLRCIIFVQQRISAYIVSDFINQSARLNMVACYVTGAGKITPSIKMTPTGTKASLNQFRNGEVEILVATATAEEVSIESESNRTGNVACRVLTKTHFAAYRESMFQLRTS